MAKLISPQQELLNFATPKELNDTLSIAFQEFFASEYYSDMEPEDRRKALFHWEILRAYLEKLEPPKKPGIFLN